METTIKGCEVCDGAELIDVLDLGAQPMCDDLVPIGSDERPAEYPLRMVACPTCLTVHQAVQVEKKLLFPKSYHYRAAMTQDVIDGMGELVESVKGLVGSLDRKQILDIGCNDGSLLSIFKRQGARTVGIEPTGAAADARGRVDRVIEGYFDADAVASYLQDEPKPDVITFTNVFAHIEDLNGVLDNLRRLMKPETKLVVENHYLGSVVKRDQFDTFYHEHPRTYSFRSFEYIARKLGLVIEHVEFPPRYNGNIRVVMGNGTPAAHPDIDESDYLSRLQGMGARVRAVGDAMKQTLQELVAEHGPLPAKGFPGRAAIIVHYFGIDERLIDAAYERTGSPKIGNYVPGTKIEIRDEAEFFAKRLDAPVLVNLAWHINDEIVRYMRANGYKGRILPIFE